MGEQSILWALFRKTTVYAQILLLNYCGHFYCYSLAFQFPSTKIFNFRVLKRSDGRTVQRLILTVCTYLHHPCSQASMLFAKNFLLAWKVVYYYYTTSCYPRKFFIFVCLKLICILDNVSEQKCWLLFLQSQISCKLK